MPEISGNALAVAIQVIDEKIWMLKAQVDQADESDDDLIDLEDEMLAYVKTADELRVSYEEALKTIGNLPFYEDLVRKK